LIYRDLFSPSLFYLPATFPVFQTSSSICLNSFTLILSPSQSCVKQVSKAGMLRGKKDHHEDEQLLLITHMHRTCIQRHHTDQTRTCITITQLHTMQTKCLNYSRKAQLLQVCFYRCCSRIFIDSLTPSFFFSKDVSIRH